MQFFGMFIIALLEVRYSIVSRIILSLSLIYEHVFLREKVKIYVVIYKVRVITWNWNCMVGANQISNVKYDLIKLLGFKVASHEIYYGSVVA